MIRSRDCPTASSEEKPKIRSAPGFQNRIRPSQSAATIASDVVVRTRCAKSSRILIVVFHLLRGLEPKPISSSGMPRCEDELATPVSAPGGGLLTRARYFIASATVSLTKQTNHWPP